MMNDYKKIFNDATNKILGQIEWIGADLGQIREMHNLVVTLRDSIVDPDVRARIVPTFHQMNFYPARGFCEPATLAWIHYMGPEWILMQIRGTDWAHGPHFYARRAADGRIVDLTQDQYGVRGLTVPYHLGRAAAIDRRRKKLLDTYLNTLASKVYV